MAVHRSQERGLLARSAELLYGVEAAPEVEIPLEELEQDSVLASALHIQQQAEETGQEGLDEDGEEGSEEGAGVGSDVRNLRLSLPCCAYLLQRHTDPSIRQQVGC